MADLLILNGYVVTMDRDRRILKDGAVAISGNRIVEVGESKDLKKRYSTETTINAQNKLVLPGLIDVHTHLTLAIGRGNCEDQGAQRSLYGVSMRLGKFVKKSDRYILGKLGCLEEVRFGATCIAEGSPEIPQVAPAIEEVGARGVLSDLINDYDREILIEKQKFEYIPEKGDQGLKRNMALIDEWDGKANGRINCVFGPQAADFCSEDLLRRVREAADEYQKRITVHLAQSMIEVNHTQEVFGKTPFKYLRDIGLLGPDVIAAHCYHCTEEDIDILKTTKTNVAHNPGLNAKRGLVMPLLKFLEKGITVGLGTDNFYSDMTNNMLMAILSARLRDGQGTEPKPMRVLELATIEGARALGLDQEIGSIEAGKKADLILVNMRRPHMVPIINPVVNLVHSGNGNDCETVIIDGQIVEHEGVIQTVDEEKVLDQAQEISERIWKDYYDEYGAPS